jgi:hypothetical protein
MLELETLRSLYGFSLFFVTVLDLKETCMKREFLIQEKKATTGLPSSHEDGVAA